MRKSSINPPDLGISLKPKLDQGCTQQDAASALGLMEERMDKPQRGCSGKQRGTEFAPLSAGPSPPKPPMGTELPGAAQLPLAKAFQGPRF